MNWNLCARVYVNVTWYVHIYEYASCLGERLSVREIYFVLRTGHTRDTLRNLALSLNRLGKSCARQILRPRMYTCNVARWSSSYLWRARESKIDSARIKAVRARCIISPARCTSVDDRTRRCIKVNDDDAFVAATGASLIARGYRWLCFVRLGEGTYVS